MRSFPQRTNIIDDGTRLARDGEVPFIGEAFKSIGHIFLAKFQMQSLRQYLQGTYARVEIELDAPGWQTRAKVPAKAGWYYIETNTPFEILSRQPLWDRQYTTKKAGRLADVKNYDLKSRCARFHPTLASYWNTLQVYSGLASNLQSRAREHTFADPGTGGLALSKYPELHEFEWHFCYQTLADFSPDCPSPGVLLLLGEQVWRSQHGWPILCAE